MLVSKQSFLITNTQSYIEEHKESNIVLQTGSFSIENSSESGTLISGDGIWGSQIGATWDLTIYVHANSTTNINFSMSTYNPQWWEGNRTFILSPNQTCTQRFVLHATTDVIGEISLDFLYELIETNQAVSGTYHVEKVSDGYLYTGIVTGPIYISNITEWISSKPFTSSKTESNSIDGFLIGIEILGLISLCTPKLDKKKIIGKN